MPKMNKYADKHSHLHFQLDLDDIFDSIDLSYDDVLDHINEFDEPTSPRPPMLLDFDALERATRGSAENTKPHNRRHNVVGSSAALDDESIGYEIEKVSMNSKDEAQSNVAAAREIRMPHLSTAMVYPSNFGPISRGLLMIKAVKAKVVALVPVPTLDASAAAAFIGNSTSIVETLGSSVGTLVDLTLLKYQSCEEVDDKASTLSYLLDQRAKRAVASASLNGSNTNDRLDRAVLLRRAFKQVKHPAGRPTDMYDMFESYLESHAPGDQSSAEESWNHDNAIVSGSTCLICFDDLSHASKPLYRLQACQHGACVECWTAYIQSTAASGHSAVISCPADKCSESIGLFDIPHILFGPDATISHENANALFSKLALSECTDHCLRTDKGRHCPSPYCEAPLVPSKGKVQAEGWNIMVCSCGNTLCADCPRETGSHPGTSCVLYTKMIDDIESGKADAEYQSYRYVMNSSRPCPNCGFAIQRNGGCNHMTCTKCTYYFCWQCGGKGSQCMSHHCTKSQRLWHQEPVSDGDYVSLKRKVATLRSFRLMRERLRRIDRATGNLDRDGGNKPGGLYRMRYLVLERQLVQAMLWILSYQAGNESCEEKICLPLARLELIDHAHILRGHMVASAKDGRFTADQVAEVIEMKYDTGKLTKGVFRHKKSLERAVEDQKYEDAVAGQQLQMLSMISDDMFHRETQLAIEEALSFLLVQSTPTVLPAVRRQRKVATEANGFAGLNQKKERSNDPWKSGLRVDPNASSARQEGVGSWKGKARVKILRGHALNKAIGAL